METLEIWKDIPGYEGLYEASTFGRIKSLKYGKERIMSSKKNKGRYYKVFLNTKNNYLVHRLVASAFLGLNLSDNNICVCHKDDDTYNNILDNLFLGTQQDNMYDMIKKGRYVCGLKQGKGELSPNSKIKNVQAIEIRDKFNNGKTISEIAKEYFVSYETIRRIVRNIGFKI